MFVVAAIAMLGIAAFERGHSGLAVRCPERDGGDDGYRISRLANRTGQKRFGQSFDVCSPDFLDPPVVPAKYPPHSGKNSQPGDKKP